MTTQASPGWKPRSSSAKCNYLSPPGWLFAMSGKAGIDLSIRR
jgi:hypothetical protein